MARPTKDANEKLSETVKLRMTVAEHEHVRVQARVAGVTVSDYLRRRAVGYIVPEVPASRRADLSLVNELNRIGVNMNQIARTLNAGRPERIDLDVALAELRGVFDKVLGSMEAE